MNKEEKQKILGIIEQLDGKQYLDSGEIISLKIELKHAMPEESELIYETSGEYPATVFIPGIDGGRKYIGEDTIKYDYTQIAKRLYEEYWFEEETIQEDGSLQPSISFPDWLDRVEE